MLLVMILSFGYVILRQVLAPAAFPAGFADTHLAETLAEVTFNDIDGCRRANRWPRTARQPLDTASTRAPIHST
jgi:hypothetical protein